MLSIQSSIPGANIKIRLIDLSSFDSIKKFASEFLLEIEYLDILFLNAGVSCIAPSLTTEGYERQFGINHVGHALLTQLLMPKILQAAYRGRDVRILVTSSMAIHINPPPTGLILAQIKKKDALASAYQRYAHSKLANVLFARKLAQVYPSIKSVSYHPGQVKTDLFSKANGINKWLRILLVIPLMWVTGVSPEKGAENGLWLAVSNNLKNGGFYTPVGILEDQKPFITNQKLTDELWDWTNRELCNHGAPGWI